MADFDSPEGKQQWEARISTEVQLRQKLRQDRTRLKQQLEAVNRRLQDDRETPEDRAMLGVLQRFFQSGLRQIALYDVDGTELKPFEPATLAAMELGNLETMVHMAQLQQLNLEALHQLLARDWAAAVAGEGPTQVPASWLKVRGAIAQQPAWTEAVRRFEEDYPAYRESVQLASELYVRIEAMPAGQAKLQALKELNLPAIKGMHYRLESLFRPLPHGEAVLQGTRRYVPEAEPAAGREPVGGAKRSLTDRLKNMFKA
jgi:hypothetical protein